MEVTVPLQGLSLIDTKSKLDRGSQAHENSESPRMGVSITVGDVSAKPQATR